MYCSRLCCTQAVKNAIRIKEIVHHGKTLFARVKCDGMTLDSEGHVYLTETAVLIHDASGKLLGVVRQLQPSYRSRKLRCRTAENDTHPLTLLFW